MGISRSRENTTAMMITSVSKDRSRRFIEYRNMISIHPFQVFCLTQKCGWYNLRPGRGVRQTHLPPSRSLSHRWAADIPLTVCRQFLRAAQTSQSYPYFNLYSFPKSISRLSDSPILSKCPIFKIIFDDSAQFFGSKAETFLFCPEDKIFLYFLDSLW